MKVHPVAELFPMLSGDDLRALAESIRKDGLLNPCVQQNGILLDGRNRLAACKLAKVKPEFIEYSGDDPTGFIVAQNIHRRHLDESQRAMVAARLATLPRGVRSDRVESQICDSRTQAEAADMLNVGKRSVEHARKVIDSGTPELVQAVESGKLAVSAAAKIAKAEPAYQRSVVAKVEEGHKPQAAINKAQHEVDEVDREKARESLSSDMPRGGIVLHGDFRGVGREVKDASCTLIFTDPPYDRESLPLFGDLAEFADRILVDGGSLVTFCGQFAMDTVMANLSTRLRYFWTCCCLHTGGATVMREYGIKVLWKPMLWFVKGAFRYDREKMIEDLVESQQEKDYHPWQQSVIEAKHFIEALTSPGDLVCDPFAGGGTTAVAAKEMGRKYWTCEIDARHVKTTRDRLA